MGYEVNPTLGNKDVHRAADEHLGPLPSGVCCWPWHLGALEEEERLEKMEECE
jgi:hypothetical protein